MPPGQVPLSGSFVSADRKSGAPSIKSIRAGIYGIGTRVYNASHTSYQNTMKIHKQIHYCGLWAKFNFNLYLD